MEQSRERFILKQKAEDAYQQFKNIPAEEAAKRWEELNKVDKELAAKVSEIAKQEKKNLNYTDRMILDLGVANGERAQYLATKFYELDTKEQKAALWDELSKKGVITKDVKKQLTTLLNAEKP
jgi:hypothetical protein